MDNFLMNNSLEINFYNKLEWHNVIKKTFNLELNYLTIYENKKNDFNWLFSFDIEKEAGEVSEKVKLHISNIGRKFIFTNTPFCIL